MLWDKLFTIAVCFFLLLSGMLVAGQGIERDEVKNEEVENDIKEGQKDQEYIRKRQYESKNQSHFYDRRSKLEGEMGERDKNRLNNELKSIDKSGEPVRREALKEEKNRILLEELNSSRNYTTRNPIRIDNNDDLAMEASSGSGTKTDPYILEGYKIDGGGHGYSIYIGNVTDHFRVRECYLHNSSGGQGRYFPNSGISLFDTSNGEVQNNYLTNNSQGGIYLYRSHNIEVSNNSIHSNDGHGIQMYESEENKIVNNDMNGEVSSFEQTHFKNEEPEYCDDTILVKLEPPKNDMVNNWGRERALQFKTDEVAATVDGTTKRTYPEFNMAEISLTQGVEVKAAVDSLNHRRDVITAEPNYVLDLQQKIPNDPGYDSLWAMPTIDAPEAWDITVGDEEVVVAVIDTGIDYTHPDLKENMWTSEDGHHGYNAINDSYDPMDDHGHGTHVAGTIGAVGDNEKGVVGVNWNVSLMGIRFLGETGGGTTADAIAGLEYVLERKREGENIVATSNSWRGTGYSELLYEAIEKHQKEGISFIAAAGNARADTDETPFYPANYDLNNIISVAATNEGEELAFFSNYGERTVHVGAPGVEINSTILDGEYGYKSGTSMAAPHVSGLMALLKSHNPSYDHNQLKNAILSSTDRLESLHNLTLTDGRINAHRALDISPDPDDIRFWIHRPTSEIHWGEETSISISLNDGVNPVIGANVSVEFNTGEEKVYLEDDGSGGDLPQDGYYTGRWTPRNLGEVNLTIIATIDDDREIMRNLTVEVIGNSGISLLNSEENILRGNNVTNNYHGISLIESYFNEMTDNILRGNTRSGMRLLDSNDNELMKNRISNSQYGLLLEYSNKNHVIHSDISDTSMGIMLQHGSNGNTLINNTISDNSYGFIIENSEENKVMENKISDNLFYGLVLALSNNNILKNNNISENWISDMYIVQSNYNNIANNTMFKTDVGFFLVEATGNKLRNNTALNKMIGIYLSNSRNTTLSGNTMIDIGIYIEGPSLEHWATHSIDKSNTINDNPIYYLKNEKSITFSKGAGQVILANCTDVTVKDQEISSGGVGILLGFSSNNMLVRNEITRSRWEGITLFESDENILRNNSVRDNEYPGIFLLESEGNILNDNLVFNNGYGIFASNSDNNTIISNRVIHNSFEGIALSISNRNRIEKNSVSDNEFGIALIQSQENTVITNIVEDNSFGIFTFLNSIDNIIEKNTASNNDEAGLVLLGSSNNIIQNNTASNNDFGIILERSSDNTLRENTGSSNNWDGIILVESSGNLLESNYFLDNDYSGIFVLGSEDNKVLDNILSDNIYGIYIHESDENEFRKNIVNQNDDSGIFLEYSRENTFKNNSISEAEYGITLIVSFYNEIIFNNISKNERVIDLFQSNYNSIEQNVIAENEYGIHLELSDENEVSDNLIYSNEDGPSIILIRSEDNKILANTLVDNYIGGIGIVESNKITLKNNTMEGEGIFLGGSTVDNWNTHTIDTSNTVNGNPVYYRKDKTGGTVTEDAGQVILANCTEISVENQKLSNSTVGIQLGFSENNTLSNNNIKDNLVGIEFWKSNENNLANNMISYNEEWGIYIQNSHNNLIYQNKFVENEEQAYDDGENDWNDEDPAEGGGGGNYWSDYEGEDRKDGIGDEPYEISGNGNQDNFPWVTEEMVRWYELTLDFEGEGTIKVDGEEFNAEKKYIYEEGSEVELEAIPDDGWKFEKWTGNYQSEERVEIITMDETKNITGIFEEKEKSILERMFENIIDFVKNILNTIVDFISDIIPSFPDTSETPDIPQIPGFSFFLLLLGLVGAGAIHHTKKR